MTRTFVVLLIFISFIQIAIAEEKCASALKGSEVIMDGAILQDVKGHGLQLIEFGGEHKPALEVFNKNGGFSLGGDQCDHLKDMPNVIDRITRKISVATSKLSSLSESQIKNLKQVLTICSASDNAKIKDASTAALKLLKSSPVEGKRDPSKGIGKQ
ncbi:MAG: hypothetical protein ACXWRE_00355 [Pseudobdellovibrionaceae bacterium]